MSDATKAFARPSPSDGIVAAHPRTGLAHAVAIVASGLDWLARSLLVLVLIAELGLITIEVGQRFLFDRSFLWSEEISRLALLTLAFLGGALAYRSRQNTAIEFVVAALPAPGRAAIAAGIDLVILGVALVCLSAAYDLFGINVDSVMPMLQWNLGLTVVPFSIGMALTALFAIERLIAVHRLRASLIALPIVALVGLALFILAASPNALPGGGGAILITLAAFFACVLLGMPVGFGMLFGSIVFLLLSDVGPMIAVAQNTIDGSGHFILLTLPFFIWAGLIMERGGISIRLVRFAMALVGHFRGGLLQVVIITTYLVSGVSGSKVADVVAVGSVMREELRRKGYRLEDGAAVLSASAAMSETIPPSIAMLVLGSVVPVSIGGMFIAGILPAAVLALLLMIVVYAASRRGKVETLEKVGGRARLAAAGGAVLPLLMPVILIVGIKFGVATPTEVSSAAVVYGLAISWLVYRSIGLKAFIDMTASCGVMAGMVLFIIAASSSFAWTMSAGNLPFYLVQALHAAGDDRTLFLIGSILILVTVGSLLEGIPALIILAPILYPIAAQIGLDGVHYAMVLLLSMGVGIFMPPIGIGFHIACSVMDTQVEAASRAIMPYLVILILGILLLALVPWFTHALPIALG